MEKRKPRRPAWRGRMNDVKNPRPKKHGKRIDIAENPKQLKQEEEFNQTTNCFYERRKV